jgi:hypothetical protein
MQEIPNLNLGTNSLTTLEWLSVSRGFNVVGYRPSDVLSSFTRNIKPILIEEVPPSPKHGVDEPPLS